MPRAELPDVGLFASIPRFGDLAVHAVLDLRRSFSRAELERALAATLEAFPVLGGRYEARFWRDRWAPVDAPVSASVHVEDAPADLEAATRAWVARPLAPARERPIRVVVLRRAAGDRMILALSHLAVDGGGLAAVGHVLGSHLYGVAPQLPVDARRGVRHALDGLGWMHLPVLARDLAAAIVQPLATLRAAPRERAFPAAPGAAPSWRHLVLEPEALGRIKARCRTRGASVNDVLVAALARVAAGRSSGGAVVVLYTMDLRRYGRAPRLTAANTSSILTAVVPRRAVRDLASAAAAVAAVTARHRRGLAGPAFMLAPLLLATGAPHGLVRRLVPRLHPLLVDLPLDRGLMVTNVGRIDEGLRAFGDDIEDVRVIGPWVERLPVPAVVAFGFRGRLHLELFAASGLAPAALEEMERELREALELDPAAA